MSRPKIFPQQQQELPGEEYKMVPQPEIIRKGYKGSEKLTGKIALITGGDSGIGRSIAVHFAREGAHIAIIYLKEDTDAMETKTMVEEEGRKCLLLAGNLRDPSFCRKAVADCAATLNGLNIVVNNAAVQFPKNSLEEIDEDQLRATFETNIHSHFHITKEALKYLGEGDTIINTSSVTAYRGSGHLLDYSSTKGAIVSFTRSLSANLVKRKIRVNGVAPGPIWTPLIPATFNDVSSFGQDTPLGRAGQPSEVAPAYVFLASADSSYITGQFIHVNGGEIIGG